MSLATDFFASKADQSELSDKEYLQDGIKYCSSCHEPKQCRIMVENMPFVVPTPCQCQRSVWEQQEKDRREESKRNHIAKLRRDITDSAYKSMNFQASDADLGFAHKYVSGFEKYQKQGLGLMLLGTCGTGKTFAAACIANALVDREISVYMAHISEMIRRISQNFDEELPAYLEKIKNCSLLVIDDFGTQRSSDFVREQIDTLIDLRCRSSRPIIITSNLQLEDFKAEDAQLGRAYDRLKKMCHPILMNGESRRRTAANQRYKQIKEELGC